LGWAIAEARLLDRLMDVIPKPPKTKAGNDYNKNLGDFYTKSVVMGEADGHLSDIILVSP